MKQSFAASRIFEGALESGEVTHIPRKVVAQISLAAINSRNFANIKSHNLRYSEKFSDSFPRLPLSPEDCIQLGDYCVYYWGPVINEMQESELSGNKRNVMSTDGRDL